MTLNGKLSVLQHNPCQSIVLPCLSYLLRVRGDVSLQKDCVSFRFVSFLPPSPTPTTSSAPSPVKLNRWFFHTPLGQLRSRVRVRSGTPEYGGTTVCFLPHHHTTVSSSVLLPPPPPACCRCCWVLVLVFRCLFPRSFGSIRSPTNDNCIL